ncbi:uncharacterized protein LOC113238233 [Hyposmocoma kahamanoa]|uniref:uncharacterized protein LOC113238233 n=1 Tax=Hyposmocoma kahamanoa TaxID=1477025 RepID=UPI000E6D9E14|nr:uncharacterized protein LOC113238233 [Hyposmocoma kahamanoa]
MIYMCIIAFLCSSVLGVITEARPKLGCDEQGDCLSTPADCKEICGCDKIYIYNKTTDECVLNVQYFTSVTEKYHTEEKIRKESEKVFGGILMSAILFVSCASLCAVTACIYCCRIHYMDVRLHNDVKALARKLDRDGKLKKSQKKPLPPVAESCNVIVEDAGVFVC